MEEEITLRELIEIILKRKKVLLSFVTVCLIASIVLSFFIIKPTYEAECKINVSGIYPVVGFLGSNTSSVLLNEKTDNNSNFLFETDQIDKDVTAMLSSLISYPYSSVNNIKEEILNPVVIEKTINELKLDPKIYSYKTMKEKISAEIIKDTSIISIKVKDNDPVVAKDLSNSLAKNLKDYIVEKNKDYTDSILNTVQNLIKLQDQKIKNTDNPKSKEKLEKIKDAFETKYHLLELIQESGIGSQKITILQEALLPEEPVSPKKALNIALSIVLGIMLGFFAVFFVEYWDSTGVKKNEALK
ncbi:MAG: YveK family protein [Thermovenabulum sp.]|uniref:YveK family protein n=1 Tax=Thermovenabulum sp. TaxID=3100335 RepID=UPI003C7CD520